MKEQIKEIFCSVLEISPIADDISTDNCVAWDSLKHLGIIMELEMTFGVEFSPEEIAQAKSLDKIIEFVNAKQ